VYCVCFLRSASGDGLPVQKFQVCARTKKCNIVTAYQDALQRHLLTIIYIFQLIDLVTVVSSSTVCTVQLRFVTCFSLNEYGSNNYHKRFLTEVSVNGGVALKALSGVMADLSSMFVKQVWLEINDACALDFSRSEFSFVQYIGLWSCYRRGGQKVLSLTHLNER